MTEVVRCENRLGCRTVLGEVINGRLVVTRAHLMARGGTVEMECRKCGQIRVIALPVDKDKIEA